MGTIMYAGVRYRYTYVRLALTGQWGGSGLALPYGFLFSSVRHAFRSRQRARASRRIWPPRPLLFFRLPDPVPWPTPFLPRLPLDCAAASRSSGELPVGAWLGLALGLGLGLVLGLGLGSGSNQVRLKP